MRQQVARGEKVGLLSTGHFDTDVYTSGDKSGYVTSIPANEEEDVILPPFSSSFVNPFINFHNPLPPPPPPSLPSFNHA